MNSIENAVTSAFGQLQSQTNVIVAMMTKHDNVIRSLLEQILVKLDSGCSPTHAVVMPVVVFETISTTVNTIATVTVFCPQSQIDPETPTKNINPTTAAGCSLTVCWLCGFIVDGCLHSCSPINPTGSATLSSKSVVQSADVDVTTIDTKLTEITLADLTGQ
ncbi:hypothetical protein BDEG_27499 [Batrachochytrium dendrobatidis JEL423]|uniref:Uncharacterized protein n=1 Tax=Batrachochytrium dendrobatidis (strain JEL423) TaxID=403673 RepID=A0A177WX82_BATDL|nr:hypothetical protein BDEG_27499 [Batrachochytrium dendrobatidis JEL423]